MPGFFESKNKVSSEEQFWNWFKKNKSKLELFIDSEIIDYGIYNQLTEEIHTIMKIGYIDFYHLNDNQSIKNGISILELRKLIERELYLRPPLINKSADLYNNIKENNLQISNFKILKQCKLNLKFIF